MADEFVPPASSLPVSPGPAPAAPVVEPEPVPAPPAPTAHDDRLTALEVFAKFVTERFLGSSAAGELAGEVFKALEAKK